MKRRYLIYFIIFAIALDGLLTFLVLGISDSYLFKTENYADMADVFDCISVGHFLSQEEMENYQLDGVSNYTANYSLKTETWDVHIYGKAMEHIQYVFTKDFELVSYNNFKINIFYVVFVNSLVISVIASIIVSKISYYKTSKEEKG